MPIALSRRVAEMQESPIRKLIPLANQARKRGITVHPLNIGQPDIHTPEPVLEAIRTFDQKVIAYSPSPGEDYLLDAFAQYYKRNKIPLEAGEMIVTTGGSEALFFAFLTVCNPGDEIIVFEPFYTNYNSIAGQTGVVLRPVPTLAETGFQLPAPEIIARAINDKTRAILICNPNNPTGTIYPLEALEGLATLAKKHHLFIMADEVYREFTYDGLTHHSVMQLPQIQDRAILLDSISKRYSACGARIGVIGSKNKKVMAACLKLAQARLSSPTVEQWAAKAGVMMDPDYFAPILAEYQRRRDTVMDGLKKIPGVVCRKPTGAFYVIAKLPIRDADAFARWLLTDFDHKGHTVLVAPAAGFYATPGLGTNEIRISYVLEVEKLKQAMNALVHAVAAFAKIEQNHDKQAEQA